MEKRVIWALVLVALLLLTAAGPALAAEAEATEAVESELTPIYTVEDLMAMEEDPSGSYILMNDLDMTGIDWKPLDFCGSLDGGGHAILNLTLSQPGDEKADSCDGNRKLYETSYVGLFGTLRGASVQDLKLINVRGLVETDSPCFLAGLAGYSLDSTITGCTVTGTLELRAHDRMFGIGGVVGYGSGSVEGCQVDVTLICTDTDAATKDEQFLGGVYATGFMDVLGCDVTIDGYGSEHGYVHNGGIVGMYMEYPLGGGKTSYIKNNSVTGKITFFEDNYDRRAYCSAYAGETLARNYAIGSNTSDFLRDERWVYDTELRPETCQTPVYTETVVEPGCDTYGYTEYTCQGCGYTYTDLYTLFQHSFTNWTVTVAATTEQEGLSVSSCDHCGVQTERTEPMLEPEPTTLPPETTEAPAQPVETAPRAPEPEREQRFDGVFFAAVAVDVLLLGLAVFLWTRLRKNRRR